MRALANPTIHAVARAAGVSSGTVSNALNHPAQLAPEMIDATISPGAFGTFESTLRMKWTRHRCQAAPANTVSIAKIRPV